MGQTIKTCPRNAGLFSCLQTLLRVHPALTEFLPIGRPLACLFDSQSQPSVRRLKLMRGYSLGPAQFELSSFRHRFMH